MLALTGRKGVLAFMHAYFSAEDAVVKVGVGTAEDTNEKMVVAQLNDDLYIALSPKQARQLAETCQRGLDNNPDEFEEEEEPGPLRCLPQLIAALLESADVLDKWNLN